MVTIAHSVCTEQSIAFLATFLRGVVLHDRGFAVQGRCTFRVPISNAYRQPVHSKRETRTRATRGSSSMALKYLPDPRESLNMSSLWMAHVAACQQPTWQNYQRLGRPRHGKVSRIAVPEHLDTGTPCTGPASF